MMKRSLKRILVTGGAGFIGSSFLRYGVKEKPFCEKFVNLDLLTYAADLDNVQSIADDPRYLFVQGDIRDESLVERLCVEENIEAIVHFAAMSHVDQSIEAPGAFYETNVGGTVALLEVVRRLPHIHFHHISTDEVYGSLASEGKFSEDSPYRPNSPYAASKASSDHFVRSYAHTYSLSTTLSHCTNNYGPCQHREKFLPTILHACLQRHPIPIYGTGRQVRDWLFVDDHTRAIWTILEEGDKGEVYDIGGDCEKENLDVVSCVIAQIAEKTGVLAEELHSLVTFVADRPGHDLRYAIDAMKIKRELGWTPRYDFTQGLSETLEAYLGRLVIS